MALSHKQLVEKLNQRLSGASSDDPKEFGADEIEEIEPKSIDPKEAYPIDFEPLKKSLNKTFGKEAFLYPEKENDEIMCVYFDPEIYKIKSAEGEFTAERMQDWCFGKGFSIVSKMGGSRAMKVYFTKIREPEEEGEEGEKGEKFSKTNFGKVPAGTNND
jgi:hypothetical protein